jgi:lipoate-protein ligase B
VTPLLALGSKPYGETLTFMRELHARVAAGTQPDTWLLVEHEPVITLGRNAKRSSLRLDETALAAHGLEVAEIERGGDATYHGPGQLVVYPIARLARFREVVPFVSALERSVVSALETLGVTAHPRPEHRGVYVGTNSICAIGLAVKSMTSLHGLALNVSTELDYDRYIDPCGMPEFGITSVSRELGRRVALEEAADALLPALEREFSLTFERDLAAR